LQGDTSVGKTSLVAHLAALTGHACVRVNNHEHTDIQAGFRIRIYLMRIRKLIRIQHFSNCGSGFRLPDPDPGFDDLILKKNL
jgi:MoxR-like ATPase